MIPNYKLAQYLRIAEKQRSRALEKFKQDYGPDSSIVKECMAEIGAIELAIAELTTAQNNPKK